MFTSKLVPVAITGSIVLAGAAVAGGTYLYKKFKKDNVEEDIDVGYDESDIENIFDQAQSFLDYYAEHEAWYNNDGTMSIVDRTDIRSKFRLICEYEKYLRDNNVDSAEIDSSIETIRRIAIEAPDIFDNYVEFLINHNIEQVRFDIADALALDKLCFSSFYNCMSAEKLFNRHMNFILCLDDIQQYNMLMLKDVLKRDYARASVYRTGFVEYGETMYNIYYTFEKCLDKYIDTDGKFDSDEYYEAFKEFIDKYVYEIDDTQSVVDTEIPDEEVVVEEVIEIDEKSEDDDTEIEASEPTETTDQ